MANHWIQKIYRRQFLDTALWAYVQGQKRVLPNITNVQAIADFKDHFGLTEEELDERNALSILARMNEEARRAKREGEQL